MPDRTFDDTIQTVILIGFLLFLCALVLRGPIGRGIYHMEIKLRRWRQSRQRSLCLECGKQIGSSPHNCRERDSF